MAILIPNDAQPISGPGGTVTTPWRQFLDQLAREQAAADSGNSALAAEIAAIANALGSPDGTVAGIPDQSVDIGLVLGQGSIRHFGVLTDGNVFLSLQGDDDAPPATYYYGTDATGTKGWYAVADTVEADVDLTKTVDANGVTTFGLADLADSGTGTFKLLTRDGKGRVSGTADGDTDDVPEGGTNLYHTAARVRATVLTGLSTATNAVITATDGVLSAFGKLQAQISGLITQTITNGDTTHAPSGDAVFDAMAGKLDKSGGTVTGTISVGVNDFRIAADTADGSDTRVIRLTSGGALSATRGAYMQLFGNEAAGGNGAAQIVAGAGADMIFVGAAVRCQPDLGSTLGSAPFRWSEVFADNSTINTSDAREKTAPRDLTAAELACAADLARLPSIFRWLHAIEEKGDDARLHCSPTVQSVIACMEKHGLDPFRYGFVCYDEWGETPEVKDEETGEVVQEHRPAGNRYSLRPSELAHFVMRGLAHRLDRLESQRNVSL